MVPNARSTETRRRLLEAAAEVFAAEGFRNATIQQICTRAGANIAAAHYHFGGKEGLYTAVFDWAARQATERDRAEDNPDGPPEARLRTLVTRFLTRLLGADRPTWMARLVAREMIEPTRALDRLVRRRMRANHEQFAAVLRELAGSGVSDDAIRLATLSVVAQCVFYRNSAPVVSRLYPDLVPTREREIERIADHVTRFSVAAIRGLRPRRKGTAS
jgi:TetR/AcrR family transcriptional regulator, regulator of cefoperazone and chloramphenicol sensitivity